jgi:hypothetical protein
VALLVQLQMLQEAVLVIVPLPTELAERVVQRYNPCVLDLPIRQVRTQLGVTIQHLLAQQAPPVLKTQIAALLHRTTRIDGGAFR